MRVNDALRELRQAELQESPAAIAMRERLERFEQSLNDLAKGGPSCGSNASSVRDSVEPHRVPPGRKSGSRADTFSDEWPGLVELGGES